MPNKLFGTDEVHGDDHNDTTLRHESTTLTINDDDDDDDDDDEMVLMIMTVHLVCDGGGAVSGGDRIVQQLSNMMLITAHFSLSRSSKNMPDESITFRNNKFTAGCNSQILGIQRQQILQAMRLRMCLSTLRLAKRRGTIHGVHS